MKRALKSDECRSIALEYRLLAQQVDDPVRKIEYQVLGGRWLRLAVKLEAQLANADNVIPFRARK